MAKSSGRDPLNVLRIGTPSVSQSVDPHQPLWTRRSPTDGILRRQTGELMGGFMTYARMRNRNGLAWKPGLHDDPYPRRLDDDEWRRAAGIPDGVSFMLLGDLNRMERGYVEPDGPPVDSFGGDLNVGGRVESSPLYETARATGVDVETCRKVLRFVFRDQQ